MIARIHPREALCNKAVADLREHVNQKTGGSEP